MKPSEQSQHGERTFICFCAPRNSKGMPVDQGRFVELNESYLVRNGISDEEYATNTGKTNLNGMRIASKEEVEQLENAHPKTGKWFYTVFGSGECVPEQIKELKDIKEWGDKSIPVPKPTPKPTAGEIAMQKEIERLKAQLSEKTEPVQDTTLEVESVKKGRPAAKKNANSSGDEAAMKAKLQKLKADTLAKS